MRGFKIMIVFIGVCIMVLIIATIVAIFYCSDSAFGDGHRMSAEELYEWGRSDSNPGARHLRSMHVPRETIDRLAREAVEELRGIQKKRS
jgi:flagellar basal body-associated protein FliL